MQREVPSIAGIEAVTFDVGNTLITTWPSVGHIYAEIAHRHGLHDVTPALLEARFRALWPTRLHLTETRIGWEQLVNEVFEGLTASPLGETFFPEVYDRFAQPDAWRIYDDVLPVLDCLAERGFRLAVISNWDERLRALLGRLELDARFETIVVSSEVGHAKPEQAIFDHAAAKLALPAQRVLHIGDSAEMDLRGAQAAGFRALQIHRSARAPNAFVMQSLLELPDRLSR
jgi:putative hydrolase of the HAD superfamily